MPRTRETLTLQWVGASGTVDEIHPFAVERSQGFRVYRERNFAEAGTYEARLYNSRNELIARKVFEVQ